ncbi:DNA endonuclease RBBP8 [Paramisgurnus dabryanus]|uniref:DNA endonuclease RBBP8 n=1 Tax=Paramisgurnus dabryanus TaxID=90735 RepID=UPI0031F44B34
MSVSDLSASSTPSDSRDRLQDLLNAVKEFHESTLQELQAKISKLKKERCLDAQRLSEFHSKNQQLREQQKDLQEKIRQLENRVRSGPCDRCATTEKQIQKTNTDKENQILIAELEAERKSLTDENRRMRVELERLRKSSSPQHVSSEAEDGIIPDSPLRPLSLPVVNKMKRRKDHHVRYAEKPLSLSHPERRRGDLSVLSARDDTGVLVAETCEMDVTCIAEPVNKKHYRTVVPETCRIDVQPDQFDEDDEDGLQTSPCTDISKHQDTTITNAVSNDDSQSVLSSREQQKSTDDIPLTPPNNNKRLPVTGKRKHRNSKNIEKSCDSSLDDPDETEIKSMMFASTPANRRLEERHNETQLIQMQDSKIPSKRKCLETLQDTSPKTPRLKSQNNAPFPYDQSWSVDPGADLHQYDSQHSPQPEARPELETLDSDYTFVSHSMLLRGQKRPELSQTTGIGQKANDSLADIFDKTAYGQYESCPQDESCDVDVTHADEREQDEMGEEEKVKEFRRPADRTQIKPKGDASSRNKSFACVEVVRKKDERRKLKGHYCKECEVYYAHLPEEEREKKLSSCSRHRYRYIPPSTPENFWEVGFPSTQTCVERGYIKEDEQPDVRIRRRRPYLAIFSPKAKSQNKQI